MRSIRIAILSAFAIAALASCGGGATGGIRPYLLTTAPQAIGVDVPVSLVKPAAPAAKALAGARALEESGAAAFFSDESRGAYHWIKETMWQTQKRLARAAVKMVLLDAVISEKGYAPDAAGATSVLRPATEGRSWGAQEVAAIEALLPASFAADSAFKSEARIPSAGDAASLPAFYYSEVDKVAAPAEAAYDFKVAFAEESSDEDAAAVETRTFYWTADKSGFKLAHSKVEGSGASPVVLEMNFVAYDGNSGLMAAGRQDVRGSMSLQAKADPANAAKSGVFIAFDSTILAEKADEYKSDATVAAGAVFTFSAAGYADDSGGTVNETFILSAGGSASTFYFKESFDASGRLTLAQATDSAFANPVPIPGLGVEGAVDEYADKETEAKAERQAMEGSDAAAEVKREERQHAGEMSGSGLKLEFEAPEGLAAPAVGEAWGLYDGMEAGAAYLGSGVIVEAGQVSAVLEAKPAEGLTAIYMAKTIGDAIDWSGAIPVAFER